MSQRTVCQGNKKADIMTTGPMTTGLKIISIVQNQRPYCEQKKKKGSKMS